MCSVTVSQIYSGTAADLISAIQKAVAAQQADVLAEARRPPPPPPPPPPSSDIDVASLVQALMAADTNKDGTLSSDELSALSESAVTSPAAASLPAVPKVDAAEAEVAAEVEAVARSEAAARPEEPPPQATAPPEPEAEQSPLGSLENAMAMKAADNGAPTDAALARRFLTLLAEVG